MWGDVLWMCDVGNSYLYVVEHMLRMFVVGKKITLVVNHRPTYLSRFSKYDFEISTYVSQPIRGQQLLAVTHRHRR